MKRIALGVVGLLMVFGFQGVGFAAGNSTAGVSMVRVNPKISAKQAREIALKRAPGNVVEEFVSDDEKGKILFYVLIIKQKSGKQVEVMIGAEKGEVVSVEEYEDEKDTPETDR